MKKPKVVFIVCNEHNLIKKFGKWKNFDIEERMALSSQLYKYDTKFSEEKCPKCGKDKEFSTIKWTKR